MNSADLLSCQSPDQLIAMLRKAAQQFREDASELQSTWQDDSAGKLWESAGLKLESVANKLEKEWAKV